MPRTVRDTALETRSARSRLRTRGEPYWKSLDAGLALGYRRNKTGGSWLARRWNAERKSYVEKGIGAVDDVHDGDGVTVLSFSQAQAAARGWWKDEQRRSAGHEPVSIGPYTLADALRDYFAARERKGSKGVKSDRCYAETRIKPELGNVEVAKLTTARLRRWHEDLANRDKFVRTRKGATNQQTRAVDFNDPENVRARRATANRVLTIVKAALNHAFHENRAVIDEVWRKVKPFREVDAAVVRYLSDAEAKRLLKTCEPSFQKLVQAALLTGCRYGELTRLRVSAINLDAGTINVRESKSSKPRHVALTAAGQDMFGEWISGSASNAHVFTRKDGLPWKASEQQRPLADAAKRAKIQDVSFHILRHTYGSHLAMRGVPMGVIAAQLGHADTRMTEKHYAHLAPNYIADVVRANLPDWGIAPSSTVGPDRR
jgi:integrase